LLKIGAANLVNAELITQVNKGKFLF